MAARIAASIRRITDTVFGVQHNSLRSRGESAAAPQIQRELPVVVEHRQIVVGRRGLPDGPGRPGRGLRKWKYWRQGLLA